MIQLNDSLFNADQLNDCECTLLAYIFVLCFIPIAQCGLLEIDIIMKF